MIKIKGVTVIVIVMMNDRPRFWIMYVVLWDLL